MRDYKIFLIHWFNFLDALLTLIFVTFWLVEEANPIMRAFLDVGPLTFLFVKFLLVAWAIEYLDKKLDAARNLVLVFILSGFMALTAWHIFGLVLIAG